MQLKQIQHYTDLYKDYLEQEDGDKRIYVWESQRIFQENWDLEASDFEKMYDQSLQNSKTRRLWNRESYEPKKAMLRFIRMQADFVQFIFRDLFHEEKSVGGRADRFVFYCNELSDAYIQANPKSRDNQHYHEDNYQMISLYLAFRFPKLYVPYRAERFRKFLDLVGSQDIPKSNDLERFFKVMRTINGMLIKEEELVERHQKRLDENVHYMEETLLLGYDFYLFCTDSKNDK